LDIISVSQKQVVNFLLSGPTNAQHIQGGPQKSSPPSVCICIWLLY